MKHHGGIVALSLVLGLSVRRPAAGQEAKDKDRVCAQSKPHTPWKLGGYN